MREAIATIHFMRKEGISETTIKKWAKQKKIPAKTVNDILNSNRRKRDVRV